MAIILDVKQQFEAIGQIPFRGIAVLHQEQWPLLSSSPIFTTSLNLWVGALPPNNCFTSRRMADVYVVLVVLVSRRN